MYVWLFAGCFTERFQLGVLEFFLGEEMPVLPQLGHIKLVQVCSPFFLRILSNPD